MNRNAIYSLSLACSAAMAGASLLRTQDSEALRCRSLEVLDSQGRVAMSLQGGDQAPEIRFSLRDGSAAEARIVSTAEGLVVRVGDSPPILLGHTVHGDGRRTLGLHVGDDHEVSLGVSEGRAGLTIKEQAKQNFIRLVAGEDDAVLAVGTVKGLVSDPSEKVIEGIAIVGGVSLPSLTLHGSGGAERARISLTEDGGSMVRVSQQDGRAVAGIHTKGTYAWCGTGVVEAGKTKWSTSMGFDAGERLGLLTVGGIAMGGEAPIRGIHMLSNQKESSIEMRDRAGKPRLRAASSDQEESLTVMDSKGSPMGGLTCSEEMVGVGLGGPSGPSASLGIWRDRIRFLARDQGNVERLGLQIDPERKVTVIKKDEQGRDLGDGR